MVRREENLMKKCEECRYYGRPGDAPETVEKGCLFILSEEDGWEMPCCEMEEVEDIV